MLQACSQAFDVSIFEIFFAWANGMCLCAATNDILFGDFERSVRAFEITHLSVTVTVASLLNPDNVPGVNFLVTSGEPMTDEVLNKWAQHLYQGIVVVHRHPDSSQANSKKAMALQRLQISVQYEKCVKATRHAS